MAPRLRRARKEPRQRPNAPITTSSLAPRNVDAPPQRDDPTQTSDDPFESFFDYWDRSRPHPPPPEPFRRPFSIEIMSIITDILVVKREHATVARMARVNKAMYDMVIPKLYYVVDLPSTKTLHLFLLSRLRIHHESKVSRRTTRSSTKESPYIAQKSLGYVKHLKLGFFGWDVDPPEHVELLGWLRRWKRLGFEPFPTETITFSMKYTHVRDIDLLKMITTVFKARHLRWRQQRWDNMMEVELGMGERRGFHMSDAELDACRQWIRGIQRSWKGYLESFDVPFYTLPHPSAKARHTIVYGEGEFFWTYDAWGKPWESALVKTAITRCIETSLTAHPDHSQLPTFIFFNHPPTWVLKTRRALGTIFERKDMPKMEDVIYFVNDPQRTGDIWGSRTAEWRRWVVKNYWGKPEDQQLGEEEVPRHWNMENGVIVIDD